MNNGIKLYDQIQKILNVTLKMRRTFMQNMTLKLRRSNFLPHKDTNMNVQQTI